MVPVRRSPEKPGCTFLLGLSYGGADRRRKIGGLTVPVAAAIVKLLSQGGGPHIIKIGREQTGNQSKS
jgi:hypothetical protein